MTGDVLQNSPTGLSADPWCAYRLFGWTMGSTYPFRNCLLPAGDPIADLTFECVDQELTCCAPDRESPLYESHRRTLEGESALYLYRHSECDLLRFTGVGDYHVGSEQIFCVPVTPISADWIEINLLGSVLAFWMERSGTPVFHAASMGINGRAIGLLAHSTGGKSSLAASLLQAGHTLMSDDILPIDGSGPELLVHPGYPQIRLWPDQVNHFLRDHEPLAAVYNGSAKCRVPVGRVGLGEFSDRSHPIWCLYLPERGQTEDGEITITPIPPGDALIELLRHSFLGRMLGVLGHSLWRFAALTRIAREVPMRRITYPTGVRHLPRVCHEIARDLERIR